MNRQVSDKRLPTGGVGSNQPVIGMLLGDFPWDAPIRKVSKLLSGGVVARNFTRALNMLGTVIPYIPPPNDSPPEGQRSTLAAFLRSIDVLWGDFYPSTSQALQLRRELGLPCRAVLFAGGTLPKGAEALLSPWQSLLRSNDELIFSCKADQEIWHRLVAHSDLREWILPCPVDETVFHPSTSTDREVARARYNLPVRAPLLLYVGRFNIQKNLHSLLRLFAAVRQEIPDIHLCLVGEEDDIKLAEFGVRNTGYVEWLHTLATELEVADAVTFLEPQFGEDLAELYRASDVVVNLSFYHRENFGLSQAEAQACGVPVVCTAWGGFKDVVRHGETGYLVDTVITKHGVRADWATGAYWTSKLLRDPELRAGMGLQAASWAREQFAIPTVANRLSDVIMTPQKSYSSYAYEPSDFARRYEDHKRACGWYAPSDDAHWYPRMFQGVDYELYEILMQPYATRLAQDLKPAGIQFEWIPYCPSRLELDPVRRLAYDRDPAWLHQRYLRPLEWEVVHRVDGTTSARQITDDICLHQPEIRGDNILIELWRLHLEGFVLFREQMP